MELGCIIKIIFIFTEFIIWFFLKMDTSHIIGRL